MRREHREAIDRLRTGDWAGAHALVQPLEDALACRIHALCHRIEGDLDNARYWYDRAGVPLPHDLSAADELAALDRSA